MVKNSVFYFGISSLVLEIIIQLLAKKLLMTSQTVDMTVINHKIENISENIGWVSLKLGSDYLHRSSNTINNTLYAVIMATFFCLLLGLFNAGLILSFISVMRHVHSW